MIITWCNIDQKFNEYNFKNRNLLNGMWFTSKIFIPVWLNVFYGLVQSVFLLFKTLMKFNFQFQFLILALIKNVLTQSTFPDFFPSFSSFSAYEFVIHSKFSETGWENLSVMSVIDKNRSLIALILSWRNIRLYLCSMRSATMFS